MSLDAERQNLDQVATDKSCEPGMKRLDVLGLDSRKESRGYLLSTRVDVTASREGDRIAQR